MSEFGKLTKGVFPSILKETHANHITQPFWDAAKQERLICAKMRELRHFPDAAVGVLLRVPAP